MISNIGEILQRIYDSEIHLSIGWMWDGGFDYKVGADLDYIEQEVESTGHDKIEKAIIIIADDTAFQYPKSAFAIWWNTWQCKYCGENEKPKCHKCVSLGGKLVTDELT